MTVKVTRFDESRAKISENGRRKVFDLAPEGLESNLLFHSIQMAADMVKEPELNSVAKTLLITNGSGVIEIEEVKTEVRAGDAVWLQAGSTHRLSCGSSGIHYIVVRSKE